MLGVDITPWLRPDAEPDARHDVHRRTTATMIHFARLGFRPATSPRQVPARLWSDSPRTGPDRTAFAHERMRNAPQDAIHIESRGKTKRQWRCECLCIIWRDIRVD